jgi:hypothetical protein
MTTILAAAAASVVFGLAMTSLPGLLVGLVEDVTWWAMTTLTTEDVTGGAWCD